jgi:1-acyl-sn-glycerol-3-phosphate acyltransferase
MSRRTPRTAGAGYRPTRAEIAAMRLLLEPWQRVTSPRFFGLDHVPKRRPFLLVGNHTLMGVLDVPLLVLGVYVHRGVFLRSLADHLHFAVPLWRDLLTRFGAVDGTRENCHALMRAGESILVFPGGAREVFKHKGEKYQLLWKQRLGFVRLAMSHRYPIVPFAAVGAEDCYDIVVDSDEMRRSPIGPVLERLAPRPDEIPPIVAGIGPFPRPQRFYFAFARPIETRAYGGREGDDLVCLALRAKVQHAIERRIRFLLAKRLDEAGGDRRRLQPERSQASRRMRPRGETAGR